MSAPDDAAIVNEPEARWSPTTLLTATMIVLFVLSIVNLMRDFSVASVIGFALGALFTYWVIAGVRSLRRAAGTAGVETQATLTSLAVARLTVDGSVPPPAEPASRMNYYSCSGRCDGLARQPLSGPPLSLATSTHVDYVRDCRDS